MIYKPHVGKRQTLHIYYNIGRDESQRKVAQKYLLDFRGGDEMASIEEQVQKIIAKKAKLANGKTVEQTLMEAVDYLYICIQNEIDAMYESYTPRFYERRPWNKGLRTALKAEDFLDARIKNDRIEVSLKFSTNVWTLNFDETHTSNVAVLMNNGWAWHSRPLRRIERFTDYGGYHFIEKGIAQFNRSNRWGVKIDTFIDNTDWY